MKKISQIMAQKNIGKVWGVTAQIAGQLSIFVGMMSMSLIAVTAYNTTLAGWLSEKGIHISFWMFALVLILLIAIPAVLIWKFALPSFFSTLNEQAYEHDNPIRKDLEALAKENKEMKKMLEELLEKDNEKSDTHSLIIN